MQNTLFDKELKTGCAFSVRFICWIYRFMDRPLIGSKVDGNLLTPLIVKKVIRYWETSDTWEIIDNKGRNVRIYEHAGKLYLSGPDLRTLNLY